MGAGAKGSDPPAAPVDDDVLRYRAKAHLRKRLRATRASIPEPALAERSARIIARVAELARGCSTVALFWPIEGRHEVDLRDLDLRLRSEGTRVAYPAMLTAGQLDAGAEREAHERPTMTFRFVADPAAMGDRGFGFREPDPDAPDADTLELIVVPALALDPRGHRIGYGAGYYDRALPRWAPPARTIGVAFDFQLIAEVPATEGDVALDVVVTDARTITVRG